MKEDKDMMRDIVAMRSMMERSSRFMWISPLAGIRVCVYALAGAWVAYRFLDFNPAEIAYETTQPGSLPPGFLPVIFLAITVLILAVGTAIFLSNKKAYKSGEKSWNATVRRLLFNMAVPLIAGGILILILIFKGLIGFLAPFTLLFYGLALFNASKFTFDELRSLGLIEIVLGLIASWFV